MLATILVVLYAATCACAHARGTDNLVVETRTGIFVGGLNDTYPNVRHFKYIPYAKPPVGEQRWAPPQRLANSSNYIDSTVFGPSCPQFVSKIPTAWALNITGNLIVNYGESLLSGYEAWNSAEDCLSIAIWTPAGATPDSRLPVLHYLTGGGFVTGGVNIPTQLPAQWVSRSQKHIVVTTNYRVNIFGFPNARGLNQSNFALQDQRAAVEWVHENIAAFGGDSEAVTLWGQSAGASSTDMYLFAHYDKPLVRASVSSTGVALGRTVYSDPTGSNFTFVAKNLGCDFEDAATELECMRRVPLQRIENFVGQYQDNSTLISSSQPRITFAPTVDNTYVYSNYTQRYLHGQIAKIPKILGTTAREASTLVSYPLNNLTAGPYEQGVYTSTVNSVCQAYNTGVIRQQVNLPPTWRYQWAGNFTNISPLWWMGAYHYSDLYMFFGSYVIAPGTIPQLETDTSVAMQDYLYEFANDPYNGLKNAGYPQYLPLESNGGNIARFGSNEKASQLISGDSVEAVCHIPGAMYDTSP